MRMYAISGVIKLKNISTKIYNILLPLWLLIFLPSYLWLALIPLNYVIDRVVLRWSLGDMPEKVSIPCLVQRYNIRYPEPEEVPQIVTVWCWESAEGARVPSP